MKRIACFIFFTVFYFYPAKSYAQEISVYSDSLQHYFSLMAQERDDDKKEELNKKIIDEMVREDHHLLHRSCNCQHQPLQQLWIQYHRAIPLQDHMELFPVSYR